uniref:Uncharacterized protein n=1 Tax=Micrurus lemniscatus lemniscatus TaxID=129467 RepID=A0A2D4IX74_MICLE
MELMKVALNSSSFCVKGETTVTDIMATCFIGVPVPGKFLLGESKIVIHPDAYVMYNLSKIITLFGSPVKPTKWTNQKKLVIEVKTVFPAMDCVKYKHPEKKNDKVVYNYLPTEDVFHCAEVEEVDGMTQVVYSPRGWFMFCGAYAYAFIPANAIGGPCTIGRLTTVMAIAHAKNINENTQLYSEVMNSSLYHDYRYYKEPVDDTDGKEHGSIPEYADVPKQKGNKEPHIIIYTSPKLKWPVVKVGAGIEEKDPNLVMPILRIVIVR